MIKLDPPFSEIRIAGDAALIVYAPEQDLIAANKLVSELAVSLRHANFPWLIEAVPAYTSCLLEFDLWQVDHHAVIAAVRACITQMLANTSRHTTMNIAVPSHHRLPVYYDENAADNDLKAVSAHTGLSVDQIVELHSNMVYQVFAVGFLPYFAYLGQLPAALAMPRLATPRQRVPKGAVAIADRQTAIYPRVSPGGWHILGNCPLDLSLSNAEYEYCGEFKAGDKVSFISVSQTQYNAMLEQN